MPDNSLLFIYTDGNGDDHRASAKLEATEEDTFIIANMSAPKLPPKPQPQIK